MDEEGLPDLSNFECSEISEHELSNSSSFPVILKFLLLPLNSNNVLRKSKKLLSPHKITSFLKNSFQVRVFESS